MKFIGIIKSITHSNDLSYRLDALANNNSFMKWGCGKNIEVLFKPIIPHYKNHNSLLIGDIFHKESGRKTTHEILNNSTISHKSLYQNYWGNYIFFSGQDDTFQISKDLSNTFKLFYMYSEYGIIFSSNVEFIYELIGSKPSFNIGYLSNYILNGDHPSIDTAFNNIYQLLPAYLLTTNNYNNFTHSRLFEESYRHKLNNTSQQNKQIDLSNILIDVLKPKLADYENLILDFSGGVDSSSILYCLNYIKRTDQRVRAINLFHPDVATSDELSYVSQVIEQLPDAELIRLDISDFLPFSKSNTFHQKPYQPSVFLINQHLESAILNIANGFENSKMISGQGGDHIFLKPPILEAAIDLLIEHKFRCYFDYIKAISKYFRTPILPKMLNTLSKYFKYYYEQGKYENKCDITSKLAKSIQNNKWITEGIIKQAQQSIQDNMFLTGNSYAFKPGKYTHIHNIYEGLSCIAGENRNISNPVFYPFYTLPVIESALSMSSYDLFNNGIDRYPLRKSISDRFNSSVAWRRSKGSTYGVNLLGFKANKNLIYDLCFNGYFAQSQLIDKQALANKFSKILHGERGLSQAYNLIAVELFISYWQSS
jgi:asparagine synthase (glutamine-hydrolysing)